MGASLAPSLVLVGPTATTAAIASMADNLRTESSKFAPFHSFLATTVGSKTGNNLTEITAASAAATTTATATAAGTISTASGGGDGSQEGPCGTIASNGSMHGSSLRPVERRLESELAVKSAQKLQLQAATDQIRFKLLTLNAGLLDLRHKYVQLQHRQAAAAPTMQLPIENAKQTLVNSAHAIQEKIAITNAAGGKIGSAIFQSATPFNLWGSRCNFCDVF
jgi:hypothetical protein